MCAEKTTIAVAAFDLDCRLPTAALRGRDEVAVAQGELHAAREAASAAEAKAERRKGLLHDIAALQEQNADLSALVARQADVAAPFEADKQRVLRCGLVSS